MTAPLLLSAQASQALRGQFPILTRTVRDRPLVYLDSGATSHKPTTVLDAERNFYVQHNAAPHRGAHALSEEATAAYEDARIQIAHFIGAQPSEVVFTKNATESINLLSYAMLNSSISGGHPVAHDGALVLRPGDEVLITEMEHHANLVPWQQLCERTGATLRWIPVLASGRLDTDQLRSLITSRTKLVSLTHVSNVLGTINPIADVVAPARAVGALVVLDACQSVPHLELDVVALGVDAVAFSGHKMYGPMGIGVLWARRELLEAMPPFLTGGSMIELVTMERSTFASPPTRFEAGVPMTAQAVGLAAATKWMQQLGMTRIAAHEMALTQQLLAALQQRSWVKVLGPTDLRQRGPAVAFVVQDGSTSVHPHDVGQVLDDAGVAVRVGHHCAWPLHRALGVPASVRASFGVYNTPSEVDALVAALDRVPEIFSLEV